jgi:hypothetical protein
MGEMLDIGKMGERIPIDMQRFQCRAVACYIESRHSVPRQSQGSQRFAFRHGHIGAREFVDAVVICIN